MPLHEKYAGKTPEQLAEMHSNLESKLGEQATQISNLTKELEAAKTKPVTTPTKEGGDPLLIPETAVESFTPVDITKVMSELQEKDSLSAETEAELKRGFEKVFGPQSVDQVMETFKATVQVSKTMNTERLYAIVGGAEKWKEYQTWASKNYSAPDRERLNKALKSGSFETDILALMQRKANADMQRGNDIRGNASSQTATNGDGLYSSENEWLKDVNSKEFKSDPAFRQKVQEKKARTFAAGGYSKAEA